MMGDGCPQQKEELMKENSRLTEPGFPKNFKGEKEIKFAAFGFRG
jgi:hypothetical protein